MTDLAAALGPVGAWGHLDSVPARELPRYVGSVADLGYGSLWVPETVGREPFVLLAAAAGHSGGMWLGTSIASIWARDALATRMAAMTLHELTGGRFILGLGVSHPHLAQKLRGHVYEKPLTRMREYLTDYHRLPYRGPTLPDVDDTVTEPPVMLAALRERMLTLAATETAGAFPHLITAERIRWMRTILDAAAGEGARPLLVITLPVVLETDADLARSTARTYLVPYLRAPNYQASWAAQGLGPDDWALPGSDAIVDAMVAWGTIDTVLRRLAALRAAGADHVTIIPVAADGTTDRLATLEALAGRW